MLEPVEDVLAHPALGHLWEYSLPAVKWSFQEHTCIALFIGVRCPVPLLSHVKLNVENKQEMRNVK